MFKIMFSNFKCTSVEAYSVVCVCACACVRRTRRSVAVVRLMKISTADESSSLWHSQSIASNLRFSWRGCHGDDLHHIKSNSPPIPPPPYPRLAGVSLAAWPRAYKMRCTVVFYTDSCCSSLCHRVKKNNTLRLCLHYYSNTLIELKDCSPRCRWRDERWSLVWYRKGGR